jgi:hypothetical protein
MSHATSSTGQVKPSVQRVYQVLGHCRYGAVWEGEVWTKVGYDFR